MLLFVFYAILVWYGALQGRRRVTGVCALAFGIFALVVFNTVHFRIAQHFGYEQYVPVFRVLMYPYMGMVGLVGLFLVTLPIELPRGEIHCKACRYDLTVLKPEFMEGAPCPECGATKEEATTRTGRRLARKRLQAKNKKLPEPMPGLRLRPER
ncbi:MAG: hypothetical protein Phyf2KO_08960 [Phycisphaerales bacterium]